MNKKHSKNYQTTKEKVIAETYTLADAIQFLIDNNKAKFDPTVELHLKLNLKKGKEKANLRLTVTPPSPIAKLPQIAILAKKFESKNKDINADSAKILDGIKKGKVDFDILVATPDFASKFQPFAKFLGPKGLMPTEKAGTLTDNPEELVANLLKGQKEIKADDADNLHVPCGKLSLGVEKIMANIDYLLAEINSHKPAGVKGDFILRAKLCATMSPSLTLEL
jgi:large subunit ribosomal protein L1